MQIDEFLELVRRRRSIRQFKPDPVPDEHIEKILEAARWAMSGGNGQPWEFIVVKDQETRKKIVDAYLDSIKEIHSVEQTRIEELKHPYIFFRPSGLIDFVPGFKDAPVLIVVCADRRTYQATVLGANFTAGEGEASATYLKNMANATQNLHLAVAALGLGSQWVSVDRPWEHSLKTILNVPAVLEIHTVVPVGYPAYKPQPPYRRELQEIVHYERYDGSKFRSGEDVVNFIRELRKKTRPAYQRSVSISKD